jgi:DNA-binding beta-propeller fold protein YncE
MNDTPSSEEPDGVLRPFEAHEAPPLPPVEPSKVVPDLPAPTPAVEPEPTADAVDAPDRPVAPPPPPALEDIWAPEPTAVDPVAPTIEQPAVDPTQLPTPESAVEHPVLEEMAPDAPAVDEGTFEEPGGGDEAVGAVAMQAAQPEPTAGATSPDTITLSRTVFLAGLGVLVLAVVALAFLWQSADDGGETVTAAREVPTTAPTNVDPTDTTPPPPPRVDTSATDAEIAGLNSDLALSQAEVAGLQTEVDQLRSRPAPALPGERLRRIVVSADAKFVSAQPESIAVVGAFGGVTLINPATNQVVANSNVANAATRVLRTPTSVWLTNYADSQILQIDPGTNTLASAIPFPGPDGIDKDGGTLIVASFDGGFVARIDPGSGEVTQRVDVGGSPTAILSSPDHGLWAAVFDTGELVQIDRDTFEILQRVVVGAGPVGIGFDATHLWVANNDEGTIAKVDPSTGEVIFTVVVGAEPTELVSVEGSVWVTVTGEGSLVQVDATSGEIITRTPLGGASAGGGPTGIAVGSGSIWVAMQGEQSVVRIDL